MSRMCTRHVSRWIVICAWEVLTCKEFLQMYNPPAPMNHVKYLRAGPTEMPFQNWYTANTNHFHLTDSVRWKSKDQLGWVINPVPHNLVRRIRFWRIKISGTWFYIFVLDRELNTFLRSIYLQGNIHDWLGRVVSLIRLSHVSHVHKTCLTMNSHMCVRSLGVRRILTDV